MIEAVGYIASLMFAFCGLPQAIASVRQGHSSGVSLAFLGMWLSGEVLMTVYVLAKHGLDLPLIINYVVNMLFIMPILWYRLYPRKDKK